MKKPGFMVLLIIVMSLLPVGSVIKKVEAQPSEKQLTFSPENKRNPNWDPTGRVLFFAFIPGSDWLRSIYRINPNTLEIEQLTPSGNVDQRPSSNADGSLILYDHWGDHGDYTDVYVMNSDKTNRHPIRNTPPSGQPTGCYLLPQYSPSGAKIITLFFPYESPGGPLNYVCTMNSDGSNAEVVNEGNEPTWGPSDNIILYENQVSGIYHIFKKDLTNNAVSDLGAGEYPSCTKSGKIVYVYNNDLWTMNIDGGDKKLLLINGTEPRWSFDETYVAFIRTIEGYTQIFTYGPIEISPHADLIEKYFPHIIFDEGEDYFPTDFYYDDENIDNNPFNYAIAWPRTVYVHTEEGFWQGKEYLVIEYWFYYVRDSKVLDIEVPLCPPMLAHDHDWESVYVFLEKIGTDYVPSTVTYFKHVYMVGISWEDYYVPNDWNSGLVEKIGVTHPVVYIALSSHASYQKMLQSIGIGLPLYIFIDKIPLPEFVGGGLELDFQDVEIIYVSEPSPSWPNKFGTCIDAPWKRSRWNEPWGWIQPKVMKMSFSVAVHSPVNILVTDPEGRRIGYDSETKMIVNEIPEATYSGPGSEPQIVDIPNPLNGNYRILLTAIDTGDYNVAVFLSSPEGIVSQTYSGDVKQGDILQSTITISDNNITSTPPLPLSPVGGFIILGDRFQPPITYLGLIGAIVIISVLVVKNLRKKQVLTF